MEISVRIFMLAYGLEGRKLKSAGEKPAQLKCRVMSQASVVEIATLLGPLFQERWLL